jgi:hypothetical protein
MNIVHPRWLYEYHHSSGAVQGFFIFVELKVVVGYGGPHLSLGCDSINKPR